MKYVKWKYTQQFRPQTEMWLRSLWSTRGCNRFWGHVVLINSDLPTNVDLWRRFFYNKHFFFSSLSEEPTLLNRSLLDEKVMLPTVSWFLTTVSCISGEIFTGGTTWANASCYKHTPVSAEQVCFIVSNPSVVQSTQTTNTNRDNLWTVVVLYLCTYNTF